MKINIDKTLFWSKSKAWSLQKKINSFGSRLTGSDAHRKYIDLMKAELDSIGLEIRRDIHIFDKWSAKNWSLKVTEEGGKVEEIPTTFYFPYSGETSAEGVSGELVYCGNGKGSYKKARGKIAIVEIAIPSIPSSFIFKKRTSYPNNVKLPALLVNSVIGSVLKGPNLKKAAEEGVLGIICIWKNLSELNAVNQYLPFTNGYSGCPGLCVDSKAGKRLKKLVRKGSKATLVLEAEVRENAESETIYALLPGNDTNETIIVNTHTDGTNACEENGGVALLAFADYFSKIPIQKRNRGVLFVFVTGHFQLPQFGIEGRQATSRWLRDHPELWKKYDTGLKAVAGVTIEHLGCMEWKDDKKHLRYGETGNIDYELVYTGNEVMNNIYMNALEGRTKVRSVMLKPRNGIYFGEGQPLFQEGIPTISLVPGPDYLCKVTENGDIDKLDADLMYQQIETFLKIILEIDNTPTELLGKPQKQSFGIL